MIIEVENHINLLFPSRTLQCKYNTLTYLFYPTQCKSKGSREEILPCLLFKLRIDGWMDNGSKR